MSHLRPKNINRYSNTVGLRNGIKIEGFSDVLELFSLCNLQLSLEVFMQLKINKSFYYHLEYIISYG